MLHTVAGRSRNLCRLRAVYTPSSRRLAQIGQGYSQLAARRPHNSWEFRKVTLDISRRMAEQLSGLANGQKLVLPPFRGLRRYDAIASLAECLHGINDLNWRWRGWFHRSIRRMLRGGRPFLIRWCCWRALLQTAHRIWPEG
jgi:hypothetical protein